MSMPAAVFLDTSVLDAQHYNFASTALTTFVPACAKHGTALLLPDPTEREILRHINERSQQALEALERARRDAPFLAKWKHFPSRPKSDFQQQWEVTRVARQEWYAFLQNFKVVRPGYEHVNPKEIMDWYDGGTAPFGTKSKRKEFPDAFAMAMVAGHARQQHCAVAVVSSDKDWAAACARYASLLYFETLPRLTEVLLSDDARIAAYREAVHIGRELLTDAVVEEFPVLTVIHEWPERYEVADAEITDVTCTDVSIVAIGDGECTVTFDASIDLRVEIRWEECDEVDGRTFGTRCHVSDLIPGTAKVAFDRASGAMTSVLYIRFEATEFVVRERP